MEGIIGDAVCPRCRSQGGDRTGNHLILFSNGGKYCNRCDYKEVVTGQMRDSMRLTDLNAIKELPSFSWRGVDEAIINQLGVKMDLDESTGEIANIYFPIFNSSSNEVIGYKVRSAQRKHFSIVGATAGVPKQFFGQWLCREGGKLLIIVEGESDTLAAKQILKDYNKEFYNVAGMSFGADNAAKLARDNLAWLDAFESIIVVPDQDTPGRTAAESLASIVGYKKTRIATLPLKDTAMMLEEGRQKEWMNALHSAKSYTPAGIVDTSSFKSQFFSKPSRVGIPYAPVFSEITETTHGVAKGEVAIYTGGTGCGKSQFCDENIVYWLQEGYRVGILKMEHDVYTNIDNLLGTYMGQNIKLFPDSVSTEEKDKAYEGLYNGKGRLFIIDHAFDDTSDEGFFKKMRELAVISECDIIVVDHIHALLYSVGDGQGSEHSRTDTIMRTLAQIAKQYSVVIHVVAHPRKSATGSKSAEEGGFISLDDFKGSASLKQVPDIALSLQRDITSENPKDKNNVNIHVLKNRYIGKVGSVHKVFFNEDTLRYEKVKEVYDEQGEY